ncbi:FAD binding domain-containing protein [Rhizodiscina lignyota]|uniref:FAD binding domain-containing protein n=1 Tax=Rhizodiscina lignyota TaxID=1504668 RepID=A0A9P4I5X5_9PEZI|nr:FAD binding domain-containing protein [Rhizodiscina lignyota]
MQRLPKIGGVLIAALLPLHSFAACNAATASISGFPPCDALIQAGFGDRLLFPTSPEYQPRLASYFALNSQLHPWCIVQPQDKKDVAKVMTTLFKAGRGAGDWHIAVRAGGHNLFHTNNIDTGVTIDLVNMNETTYDTGTNLASIEPGAKWLNVYEKLHEHGVVVTGGRDGTVGVGGFLLGGGLTYYMGQQGLACDNIKNFEVVLTNGTVVDANAEQNSDLWKALKGGGSNFGIVTRFDMEALPDKDLAYGLRIMPANYTSEFLDAVVYFTDHYQEFNTDALVPFLMHEPDLPVDFVLAAIQVNTEGDQNSTGLSKIAQIPQISSAQPDETNLLPLVKVANSSTIFPPGWIGQSTVTFKNDRRILARATELYEQYVHNLTQAVGADNFTTLIFYQPFPSLIGDISGQKGGNMLGLDDQTDNAILWTGFVSVSSGPSGLALAQLWMSVMVTELKSYAASLGDGDRLVYMNYADPSQDPISSYGKTNIDHIRRVAAEYDPAGLFQMRVPGGFKISRVDV